MTGTRRRGFDILMIVELHLEKAIELSLGAISCRKRNKKAPSMLSVRDSSIPFGPEAVPS